MTRRRLNHASVCNFSIIACQLSFLHQIVSQQKRQNPSRYRVVCRISQMITIVGVYHKYDFVPPACAVYFSAELGYLIAGVGTKQMECPGKWMTQITDKWQDVDEESDKDRLPLPFTGMVLKYLTCP
ncbi:unnamed protein product [Caenorhabditis sp. 36 PRJEB53466]|nr:unnamed protein product [Caenorhabditis sp. 36 PRJEB53466]